MEIHAQLNYVHNTPRKVRLVAHLVKGMSLARAELELRHLPKRSALPLLKLLKTAAANAQHNFQLNEKALFIKDIRVNEGPVLKRFMPRAFGRAAPIKKRSSHIRLTLETTIPTLRSRSTRKSAPRVRDVTAQDVTEGLQDAREQENRIFNAPKTLRSRIKQSEFVKRVFRRKAI